ncbi:hypothetical protein AVEN_222361-1 [Araneus ventricosus]|uniref:Uncharacterized protein n=1 Tax=Araneus ventricosus TaxID=182803 RepID=A0A4Y2RIG0_ARAVE|nr:hypothetical protein AVEN_222361-1 [Araneus ventricosus]
MKQRLKSLGNRFNGNLLNELFKHHVNFKYRKQVWKFPAKLPHQVCHDNPYSKESLSKRFWKLCRRQGKRVVTKVSMTRVEPFGKVLIRTLTKKLLEWSWPSVNETFSSTTLGKIDDIIAFPQQLPTKQ